MLTLAAGRVANRPTEHVIALSAGMTEAQGTEVLYNLMLPRNKNGNPRISSLPVMPSAGCVSAHRLIVRVTRRFTGESEWTRSLEPLISAYAPGRSQTLEANGIIALRQICS